MKAYNLIFNILIFSILSLKTFAQTPELIFPATHYAGSVVMSNDEKWVISGSDGEVKIWENQSGRLIKNLKFGKNADGTFGDGYIMAVSRDSKILAVQNNDSLYFFNLDKFVFDKKIKLPDPMNVLTFSSDSKVLYCGGHIIEKYDDLIIQKITVADGTVSTVQKYAVKTQATHKIDYISLSPDDSQLLVYNAVLGSRLIDLKNNKTLKTFEKDIFPYTFLQNGNMIGYSGEKEKAFFIEELEGKTYKSLRKTDKIFEDINDVSAHYNAVSYPSVSGRIAIEYQGDVVLFDANTFKISEKFQFENPKLGMNNVKNIVLSPNGQSYILGLTMKRFGLTQANSLTITNKLQRKYGLFPVSPDVHFPLQHTEGVWMAERVLFFNKGGFKMRRFPKACEDCAFTVRLTQDGTKGFVIGDGGAGVYQFDPNAKKLQYEALEAVPKDNLVGLRLFESLGLMAVVHTGGVYIVDLKTLKLRNQFKKPEKTGTYVLYERGLNYFTDISPDKTKLILYGGSEDKQEFVHCYDLVGKRLIWTHQGNWIANIRFMDNGKKVAFTANYDYVELDAANGNPIGNPIQVYKMISDWDWRSYLSPSSKMAITQIFDEKANSIGANLDVFDLSTKKQVGILRGGSERVEAVHFLKNERYMIAEEYGGLRIWDIEKQREVAKILMFEDSDDWMIVAPDGRFDASPETMKKMYFTKGKEIIPLESLYEKFYVPNLLSLVWESNLPKDNNADIKKLKSPPSVKIIYEEGKNRNLNVEDDDNTPVFKSEQAEINVILKADKNGDEISEVRFYQNNKLIFTQGKQGAVIDAANLSIKLSLVAGENRLRAIAINSQRTESKADEIIIRYSPAKTVGANQNNITLHLVVVGINAYKNPKYNLNYAIADATSFKEAIEKSGSSIFSKINAVFIKDADASKAGIESALDKVKTTANVQDLFVFYYAGHGVLNQNKDFFLVPYDVTQLYGNDDALAQKGLSANMLQQFSKDIKAQKQLFILDACQSAGALQSVAARGAAEEKAIAQLARSTGTHWLTASGSEQFASEFTQLGHGTFTYVLLEALSGKADTGGDKKITVKELDTYLQEQVPEVTAKYKGTPQYPASFGFGNDFPIGVVKN